MIPITQLSDQQLESCIYKGIVSISELKEILNTPGVISNNIINQDTFADIMTNLIDSRLERNDINWAIPYFIADDIMEIVNAV